MTEITLVNLAAPTITLVSAGLGLQGPAGIAGSAISLVATISLGGNRVITGAAAYADCTDVTTAGHAIGITNGAALAGSLVYIAVAGELDGFSGLTINAPVYLSANGTTTQILPTTGYIQALGVAISATKILVALSPPIIL